MLGEVPHRCRDAHERCLVFQNHALWAHQDRGLRRISHGSYFRVVVPPASRESLAVDPTAGYQCKPNPSRDIYDIPIILSSDQVDRPPVPRHDGNMDWTHQLADLFSEHGQWDGFKWTYISSHPDLVRSP